MRKDLSKIKSLGDVIRNSYAVSYYGNQTPIAYGGAFINPHIKFVEAILKYDDCGGFYSVIIFEDELDDYELVIDYAKFIEAPLVERKENLNRI